jgi:hypothetical protein
MEQGWQFIAVSSELGFMNQAAGALLKDLGRSNQGQVARY